MILQWDTSSLFCILLHVIGATVNRPQDGHDFVSRREFQEFTQDVNSKLELILKALAKDGPFVNTLRGMPGVVGPKGEPGVQGSPGIQGPPGPPANLSQVTARLTKAEKTLTKVRPEELRNHIFYGTWGGGIKVYWEELNEVHTFIPSSEDLEGVAWDDDNQRLYYCSHSNIYRINRDGTGVQIVFSSDRYGSFKGLALDWISGNVYAVTWDGYIIACNPRITGQLKCSAIITDQGDPNGIALNPNHGVIYFTTYQDTIRKANMDGDSNHLLLSDLVYPTGIVVDFKESKLFWAEYKGDVVRSCGLDGSNVRTVLQLPSGSYPWGLAILKDRLYWGQYWAYSIHSSSKDGGAIRLHYTGNNKVKHFTAAAPNPDRTRENHCEGVQCPGICVLNRNGYSCRS